MAVSPLDVKKLRDKTGAGFGDCKEALSASNGDFEAAEKYLKEKGLASAAKRSGRAANEGRIFSYVGNRKAGLLDVTCETDFVARNDDFVESLNALAKEVIENGQKELTSAQEEAVKELAAKIKENISVKKIELFEAAENEVVVDYIHGEGRIGVLIKLKTDSAATASKEEVRAFAFDLALHAAAFNPLYLNKDAVDPKYVKDQEEIFKTQAANLDKPANVIEGIVKGKLSKHLAGICFVDQPFVKNDKLSVAKAANEVGKEVGGTVELVQFAYLAVGQEA